MAESVDVSVRRIVVVGPDVVLGETEGPGSDVLVRRHRHVVIRGRGVVDSKASVQGQAQCHGLPGSNQPRSLEDPGLGEVVQSSALVLGTPASPGGDGLEQRPEFGGGQISALVLVAHCVRTTPITPEEIGFTAEAAGERTLAAPGARVGG
jgi:hypothetical protein